METETDTPTDVAPAPTAPSSPPARRAPSGRQHQVYFEGISPRAPAPGASLHAPGAHPARSADGAHARRARDGHLRPQRVGRDVVRAPAARAPGWPARGTSSTSPPGSPTWPATSARASPAASWWHAPIRTSRRASSCCPSWRRTTCRRPQPSSRAHGHSLSGPPWGRPGSAGPSGPGPAARWPRIGPGVQGARTAHSRPARLACGERAPRRPRPCAPPPQARRSGRPPRRPGGSSRAPAGLARP